MSHLKSVSLVGVSLIFLAAFLLFVKPGFSLIAPTTNYSLDAAVTTGSNGWYTSSIPITLSAVAGTNPVQQTTHWLDSETPLVSNTNPTTRTLIQQGQHTYRFFSTDTIGTNEATKSFDYKIDLVAPTNWNSFTLTNVGNAHTFIISVKVKDTTSGLDPNSAEFQYSTDDGLTWGYYSNLNQCNSTWNSDQWKAATISPNTSATTSATINIPQTDYCNSNWAQTKYIRIRIKDMAGLLSSKQYSLMTPWLESANGDAYSKGDIDMFTERGVSATGAVLSESLVQNNFTSTAGWNITGYTIASEPYYTSYYSKFGQKAIQLPATFPTTSGIYKTADYVFSNVPNSLSGVKNKAIVIFVAGDLFIDSTVSLDKSTSIVWIVSGNIGIRSSVSRADGIYISDGTFNSVYNGNGNSNGDDQLTINGQIISNNGIFLSRSLKNNDNLTNPAEIITLNPGIFVNEDLMNLMRINASVTWKEFITY